MRVGVIVAARRPAPFLEEALESVLSQDPPPDDVVVVDHASEPPLELRDGMRVVRLGDARGGPAAARAAGLRALRCELVALADSDDVWEPEKLAAQVRALADHPSAAVCFGRATVIDARGRTTGEQLPELEAGLHPATQLQRWLFEGNPIPASSVIVRRAALDDAGGFDPGVPLPAASDWDLWLRLAAAGCEFVCEPAARIRYRRHSGGLTSDLSRLAEAALGIHERHAGLVDAATARRVHAADLELLARARIRERRYAEARQALAEAASIRRPQLRERALRAAAGVPVVRGALGRRNPYA